MKFHNNTSRSFIVDAGYACSSAHSRVPARTKEHPSKIPCRILTVFWCWHVHILFIVVVVRTSRSQSREPWFEISCCRFEALAISFIPRCHSSLSCINEYLASDIYGYRNEYSSRCNCRAAECFPEKSKWRWNEQVCHRVKCKALSAIPRIGCRAI